MDVSNSVLKHFHPRVARWFLECIGKPIDLQERVWPLIAGGEHVLITAPAGSGKTLAAFLWAIDQLVAGKWPMGQTSVLYVSPLKALNNYLQHGSRVELEEILKDIEAYGKL